MYPTPPGETRAAAGGLISAGMIAATPLGSAVTGSASGRDSPLLRRAAREESCDPLGRRDRQPAAFAPEMGLVGVAGFHRETSRRAITGAAQEFEEALKIAGCGRVSSARIRMPRRSAGARSARSAR